MAGAPADGTHDLTRPHVGQRTRATPRESMSSTGTSGQSTPSRTSARTKWHEPQAKAQAELSRAISSGPSWPTRGRTG